MMKFNLIVALCENFGIGIKGDLPWKLKSELQYFSKTTKFVRDATKQNAVIMGKRTYLSLPQKNRILPGRLNIVLSTTLQSNEITEGVLLFSNLENAMTRLQKDDLRDKIETVWIIGGSGVYKEAMASERCHRLYVTEIQSNFECDTFFPEIPKNFKEVEVDAETPVGEQVENGIKYVYKILEKETN